MTKKWSVPENVDNKVNNLWDEETTCPKRDLDKDWFEDWLTDTTHQNEPNPDESEYDTSICERKSAGTA